MRYCPKYGVEFPWYKATREEKKADVLEGLKFGNHKGVKEFKAVFGKTLSTEVANISSFVIPFNKVILIKDVLLASMNVINQVTINEHGGICW